MEAPFTQYLDTPNKSPRQGVARRGVVLHHAAMTSFSELERLTMGAKQVSATAICKNHDFKRLMSDGWRPWSLSSAYWDSALRSVETANESTNGWTVSDASHWKLAYGVAYWATIDGFWPHRDGDPKTWTVIGHREVYTIHGASYATACPGGMDLNLVTKRAQEILRGGGIAPSIGQEDNMKIIQGGTVALVGEFNAITYSSMTGSQGFSIAANRKTYGTVTGLTLDQVNTLISEAKARRAALVAEIAKAVLAALPEGDPVSGGSAITQKDIDLIAAASAAATDDALADDFEAIPEAQGGVSEEGVERAVRNVFRDAGDDIR